MDKFTIHPENSAFYLELLEAVSVEAKKEPLVKGSFTYFLPNGEIQQLHIVRGDKGILVTDRKDYYVAIEISRADSIDPVVLFEIYHASDDRGTLH